MSSTNDFEAEVFEIRLENLKDTQDGIQQMSAWCLKQRGHHKKIVSSWLNVFKRVRVEHRLTLFYLANDVIQNSKRKRYNYVGSWATALQRATTMVRDDKVKSKILRIFQIWEERDVYCEEYLSDLKGLLNMNPSKRSQAAHNVDLSDFQSSTLISKIRDCVGLALLTDKSLKNLPRAPNCDIEHVKALIKEKSHSEDVEKEIGQFMTYVEAYNKNLAAEIKIRRLVIKNIDTAMQFYLSQRVDVKVVVSAYKNFGNRIKLVKKKLDEVTTNLPSPIPSPDINAPSPEPDTDLTLPDENPRTSMIFFKNTFNGYSSYLDGNLPFDINDFKRGDESAARNDSPLARSTTTSTSQPIEVIANRPDDQIIKNSFNSALNYYKRDPMSPFATINSNCSSSNVIPLPVPPVHSEYSSLAQASATSDQYSTSMSHSTSMNISGNLSLNLINRYNPMVPGYDNDSTYRPSISSNCNFNESNMPLLPPPMPPSTLDTQRIEDFNSTWDMEMAWTPLSTSNSFNHIIDTPVSPPNFDQEGLGDSGPVEYSEHIDNLISLQDVDHRKLNLPPDNLSAKTEKIRQLDIDHRNLISLTGSPNSDKFSWLSSSSVSKEINFSHTSRSGDTDYRSLPIVNTDINNLPSNPTTFIPLPSPGFLGKQTASDEIMETSSRLSPKALDSSRKYSPEKSSISSEMPKEGSNYDPNDMVESIDMDVSDEDLDDLLREVIAGQIKEKSIHCENIKNLQKQHWKISEKDKLILEKSPELENKLNKDKSSQEAKSKPNERPPLLATPEYAQWEQDELTDGRYSAVLNDIKVQQINVDSISLLHPFFQEPEQHIHPWNHQRFRVPSEEQLHMFCSPRPTVIIEEPMHMQTNHHRQQYRHNRRSSCGVNRGFSMPIRHFFPQQSHPNPFRNGPNHSRVVLPFSNRGRGGFNRGGYRGKFRGANSWI